MQQERSEQLRRPFSGDQADGYQILGAARHISLVATCFHRAELQTIAQLRATCSFWRDAFGLSMFILQNQWVLETPGRPHRAVGN